MSQMMPNRMVKAGDIIFHQGSDPQEGLFYICYGKVEIIRSDNMNDRVLGQLGEGDVFGEMALINSKPRNATVRALEDSGFLTLNRANFQHRVDQLDPLMRGTFRVLVMSLRGFLEPLEAQQSEHFQSGGIDVPGYSQHPLPKAESAIPRHTADEPTGSLADGHARKLTF